MKSDSFPLHALKGIQNLTNDSLEKKLLETFVQNPNKITNNYWDKFNVENGIFFDLSKVRFSNLSAVTQLTLLIESAVRSNIEVFIALPTIINFTYELHSQSMSEKLKEMQLLHRKSANEFLKNIGFDIAVLCPHISKLKNVKITELYDSESQFNKASFSEVFSTSYLPKFEKKKYSELLFPLEWIDCRDGFQDLHRLEEKVEKFLKNKEKGVDSIDVQGIKNVVISELMKNVKEHSNVDFALFSIGLIVTKSLYVEKDDTDDSYSNKIEKSYVKWLVDSGIKAQVEIYFGDSGEYGLLDEKFKKAYKAKFNNTRPSQEDLLKWSFDKWSTSKINEKIRGTKGLYRINRIVNKYNGIFHIRTADVNGGYQKGGYQTNEWITFQTKMFSIPGTLIQIKLCPYSEITKFDFKYIHNRKEKQWKTLRYSVNNGNLSLFDDFISTHIINDKNVFLILDLHDVEEVFKKDFLESNLIKLSYYNHPIGIVVYINDDFDNTTLDGIVDSINKLIFERTNNSNFQEIVDQNFEEVYDPVLVIGENEQLFWFGGSEHLVNLLNDSIQIENRGKRISELQSFTSLDNETKNKVKLHFQNDDSLVVLDINDHFTFDFTNIVDFFTRKIQIEANSKIDKLEKTICTPKLEVVSKWNKMEEILIHNEEGFALSFLLKIENELKQFNIKNFDKDNTYILIDHNQQKDLAIQFCKLLGLSQRNIKSAIDDIDSNLPRRTRLFSQDSQVILLTTFISSSETIRRLVKYVKRDLAYPLFILCLANFRKRKIKKLDTWEEATPILSLYEKYQDGKDVEYSENLDVNFEKKIKELYGVRKFVNPDYTEETTTIDEIKREIKTPDDLKLHILESKSLHYNHIGKYSDRHFTFYLDKNRILNDNSIICKKLDEVIQKWKDAFKIRQFSIYIPKSLDTFNGNSYGLINYVKRKYNKQLKSYKTEDTVNDVNVLYIDFGSITGNSIDRFISTLHNVENLMVCIIFDQFKGNGFNFYKKIKHLRNSDDLYDFGDLEKDSKKLALHKKNKSNKSNQIEILGNIDTNVVIDNLYHLPLNFFTSENCPICEHIKALDFYKIKQDYLSRFSEDRQNKLNIREVEELKKIDYPFDFYLTEGDDQFELSSILIMEMYQFKLLLENAIHSTQCRVILFEYIVDIYNNFKKKINNSDSNLYAIIYFLSHEVNWLQKEPLVFRDFRTLISKMAKMIAVMDLPSLESEFERTNLNNISSFKLAVRYKYAAITLLRSSQKLEFCSSIFEIFKSSIKNEVLSNNLFQNTLYHLISLYKNKYNKSKKYFENIEAEIVKIDDSDIFFDINQKLAFNKIKNLNKQTLKLLNIISINDDRSIIKALKSEVDDHYKDNRHPHPIEHLVDMDFMRYGEEELSYLETEKEDSALYINFVYTQKNLINNWNVVSNFIETVVQVYTHKLSDSIWESKVFKSYYNLDNILEVLKGNDKIGISDEFTELVYKIDSNIYEYFDNKKKYNDLYNSIYNNIIKAKDIRGSNKNSNLFQFLLQFPTNLEEVVKSVFEKDFPRMTFENDINADVFFPRILFDEYLKLIISNIKGKFNESLKINGEANLNVVDIKFKSQIIDSKVKFTICYNSTNEWIKEPRAGALTQFGEELAKFSGSLNHALFDDGYYKITIILQKYE